MRYEEHDPRSELAGTVRCIWRLVGSSRETSEIEPVVPDGCVEIVVHLGDPFRLMNREGASVVQPRAIFAGPSTSCIFLQPSGAIDVIGVRLEPGAAGWLVEEPISELVDRLPGLEEVSGSFSRGLVEELAEPRGNESWREVIERRILSRLQGRGAPADSVVSRAVDCLRRSGGQASLDELARRGGISTRQLERRFRGATGYGPKMFARIMRFNAALRRLSMDRGATLADVALRSGYYDQAHFSRDFHCFAGESPSRFLRERHELTQLFAGEPWQ